MFKSLEHLVFVGAVVYLIGVFSCIKEVLSGKAKPNKVTWLLWSITPLIATVAAITDGVGWSVLPVFMAGFGPLLIFIASFANPNSYWKLNKFDYLCGFWSILAMIFWFITKEPVIAIIFSIISDGFASFPTLVKAWKHPETETTVVYLTSLFNTLTSFSAIKTWSFSSYAFPVYLVVVNSLLTIFAYRQSKRVYNKA